MNELFYALYNLVVGAPKWVLYPAALVLWIGLLNWFYDPLRKRKKGGK